MASLAPGFRFHPTDEELVRYYLTRKVSGRSLRFDAISDVDVYKNEPWDLPSKSKLKSRDLEWYFFSVLDKKYGNGSKTNRATEKGYWKTTGKDRAVFHRTRVVGMKKTLVYHIGRAPKGQRTNWVMHEYRLTDEDLDKAGIAQDAFVLCRIFEKSGPGPKNGEKYGAPFVDEEWENDEVGWFPGEEMPVDDDVALGDDAYFNVNELDESFEVGMPLEDVPVPPSFYYDETDNYVEHPQDTIDYEEKPIIDPDNTHADSELGQCSNWNDLPEHMVDPIPLYSEYGDKSDIMTSLDDYLLDEPYFEMTNNPSLGGESFPESNELANSVKADTSGLVSVDEYLAYFDEVNENHQDVGSNSKEMEGTEKLSGEEHPSDKAVKEGIEQQPMPNVHISVAHGNDGASSSTKIPEPEKFKPDMDYSFVKKTGRFLEDMSYPSAFSKEYPSKDAVLRMNAASQSSSSVHVTAGIIRISTFPISGSGTDGSFTKNMDINIVQGVSSANFLELANALSVKTTPSMWLGFCYFLFIWVLILSISFKVGTSICALNSAGIKDKFHAL